MTALAVASSGRESYNIDMVISKAKTDTPSKEVKAAEGKTEGKDDACRCQDTSKMTPGELFKLMIKDLSFWKKEKKE